MEEILTLTLYQTEIKRLSVVSTYHEKNIEYEKYQVKSTPKQPWCHVGVVQVRIDNKNQQK